MPILKYQNQTFSKKINCILGDCTNSTITSNAVRTLSNLTGGKYSQQEYADAFHILLESTAITSVASLKYDKLRPIAKVGIGIIALFYLTGRLNK